MKSADDYYDELDSVDEFSLLRLIKEVQTDTIREAVLMCDKNVIHGAMRSTWETIEKQLIEKL